MARLRDEYARQLKETQDLMEQMQRDDPGFSRGGAGFTFQGQGMTFSAPGTEAFMAAYHEALAGEAPRAAIGSARTQPGTVNAAVVGYYGSVAFMNLARKPAARAATSWSGFAASTETNGSHCCSVDT